jgi:lipopolysaccharide biosynthesis glycosyltransferase
MENKINKIVIACFKKDLFLLRPCVASIRYWYPDVEIFLLKDQIQGDFSLDEFIVHFNCKIFPTQMKFFGWPWSKLSVLLKEEEDRFLFLDSDTVFLGPVLDKLNNINADFIVTGAKIDNPLDNNFTYNYIDYKKILEFDPSYKFPGYGFNGGHIIMKSGILKKEDFAPLIDFEPNIKSRFPEIFKHGDQGCLNYIFAKAASQNKFTIAYDEFWIWPGMPVTAELDINKIEKKIGYDYILHWAGVKPVEFEKYIRYDILKFYIDKYYQTLPLGNLKYFVRNLKHKTIINAKLLKYKILKMEYAK